MEIGETNIQLSNGIQFICICFLFSTLDKQDILFEIDIITHLLVLKMTKVFLMNVLGFFFLANASYSVYLFNQLNTHGMLSPSLPLDIIIEVIVGAFILLASALISIFKNPECCNDPRTLAIKNQTWFISSYNIAQSHPLRPISIPVANGYAEKMGKGSYSALETRPQFANLTHKAILFSNAFKQNL